MNRVEIKTLLEEICENVTLSYPDFINDYPLIIYKLELTGKASHEAIEYFEGDLTVEIYTETPEERSQLEMDAIKLLFIEGWIHQSSTDMSNFEHYRMILRFERKE